MLVIDHGFDGSNALKSYQRLQKFPVVSLYVLVISPMAHGKIFNVDVASGDRSCKMPMMILGNGSSQEDQLKAPQMVSA
jgi:hypothetical protein